MSEKAVASRPYMPGYGIPEGPEGMLDWGWAAEQLENSHNYWLSTARPDGRPHAMAIWGVWLDGRFYFSTGVQSVKAQNLLQNPACVITTENAGDAVILEGTAEPVTDHEQLAPFFVAYMKKYDHDMSAQVDPMWIVHPRKTFAFVETDASLATATRWRFEET
ncbi:MAG: pyridoxamine 5'-phosphate oxidase family protein [Dehalococcoidia bacterium]